MKLGKHVYCEKPLAHSIREVREMMKLANALISPRMRKGWEL
jgi:predicted dehydrogenase